MESPHPVVRGLHRRFPLHLGAASPRARAAACAVILAMLPSCCKDADEVQRESPTAAATVLCTPGESRLCHCADGRAGRQVCRSDGSGLGECECSTAAVQPVQPPNPPAAPAPPPIAEPTGVGGRWVLQIGADSDFASALHEARMAKQHIGITPVVFHVSDTYVTTVGSYASSGDAEASRDDIVSRMTWRKENRRAAGLRDADSWCGADRRRGSPPQHVSFPLLYVECTR